MDIFIAILQLIFSFIGTIMTLFLPIYLIYFISRKLKSIKLESNAGPYYSTLMWYLMVPCFTLISYEMSFRAGLGATMLMIIIPTFFWRHRVDLRRYKEALKGQENKRKRRYGHDI
jgi:hypothetical protein